MKIIITGAGLGGLTCAIASRLENLDVTVLERTPDILPVGAGIQIPPNGARVLEQLDLLDAVLDKGAVVRSMDLRRYRDGRVLGAMECGDVVWREYGGPWVMIHRADYQRILFDRAIALGAEVRLGATVTDVDVDRTQVILEDGERVSGDVVIGADGLWSCVRDGILERPSPPIETGDMAYRAVFPRAKLDALDDAEVDALLARTGVTAWLGPEKHAVFYPVRGGEEFNLVLLQPDDLPVDVRTDQGDIAELLVGFRDWNGTLKKLISAIPPMLKWKLCHLPELETWSKGCVTLLGDACHPTLPYQAQGAAMAVEDGAVLAMLLASVARGVRKDGDSDRVTVSAIREALLTYEDLRKAPTTANVQGALRNRNAFHLKDGMLQWLRDLILGWSGMTRETDWVGLMSRRQSQTLAYDALAECRKRIDDPGNEH